MEDTILNEAVRYSDLDDVLSALNQGCDPNKIGMYQWSSLHEACSNGNLDIVNCLLEYNGDPCIPDKLKQNTSYHYAAKEDHPDILQALLKKSSLWNIKNGEGKTPADIASESCKAVLKNYDCQLKEDSHDDDGDSAFNSISEESEHRNSLTLNRIVEYPKELPMGLLDMSFEYNSKTKMFKVRVWKLTDIILPPADVSTIYTIYVKSYLIPDLKKLYKRRTEEVRVRTTNDESTHQPNSLKPSTFDFTKALEYKNITEDTIQTKKIQIDACVCQRMSRKGYPIGSLTLDLKTAVKNLIRNKYLLKAAPCSSVPSSMRVYSSIPNLRSPSFNSLVDSDERASSESNLRVITVTRSCSSGSSIEIPIPEGEPTERETLSSIKVIRTGQKRETSVSFCDDNVDESPKITVETCEKDDKNVRISISDTEDLPPEVVVTKADIHVPFISINH
ncbi:DgyrCDS6676 [Dimorphilus gyrociliatus]|uniref:DgyrCDS6676 n=1 Tax=Dimorphilus gyrociliatus TaxID=2664684 RepID=A0A7I8VNV9_9ANNE|nr:DgyrCDS6676 [Dimorphilus gyrociliatus]